MPHGPMSQRPVAPAPRVFVSVARALESGIPEGQVHDIGEWSSSNIRFPEFHVQATSEHTKWLQ
eukprot:2358211-Alexandrium_andersonii.AAC.1